MTMDRVRKEFVEEAARFRQRQVRRLPKSTCPAAAPPSSLWPVSMATAVTPLPPRLSTLPSLGSTANGRGSCGRRRGLGNSVGTHGSAAKEAEPKRQRPSANGHHARRPITRQTTCNTPDSAASPLPRTSLQCGGVHGNPHPAAASTPQRSTAASTVSHLAFSCGQRHGTPFHLLLSVSK